MATRQLELVDPTACERHNYPLAERSSAEALGSVALMDATLNRASQWGAGMLDAAERVLTSAASRFTRGELNPLDVRPADLWVRPLVESYDALVLAAGDCITCTSRAARNLVMAERAGLPGALICTGSAEGIARAVARGLGIPDLHVIPLDVSLFGRTRDEIASAVIPLLDQLPSALVRWT